MSVYIIIALAAVLGTLAHWLKVRLTGRTRGNPFDYLINKPWHTLAMIGTTFAAVGALVTTGAAEHLSVGAAFWVGFATGYTADSATNKGLPP